MRKLFLLGTVVGLGLPVLAAAQPPPPPPPGGGGYAAAEPTEPKLRFDVGLIAGLPQQDLDEANTSPGINLNFGYGFTPNLGLSVGVRYFQVQVDGADEQGIDIGNYDFDIGVRYTTPISPTAKVFGEGMLIYSTLEFKGGGTTVDGSGIGFMARGGVLFRMSGNIWLGGALSYSTASIDLDGTDGDAGWLGLEGLVSFGF
jgi:Outer membrane protein beta-barrel domain